LNISNSLRAIIPVAIFCIVPSGVCRAQDSNRFVVPPKYGEVGNFYEGMAKVKLDGDRVLVDMAAVNQGFKSGGVWMVRVGNVVMVKRVQLVGAEKYQASSDNPAYPPFLLDDTCELLGRVVSLERDI
jgi:hypothetical protein